MANEENVKKPEDLLIKRVMITEKGTQLALQNRYLLEVAVKATKPQIAKAVEQKFGVHVLAVRTINQKGGQRYVRGTRRAIVESTWKKAFVTVKPGERIEQV